MNRRGVVLGSSWTAVAGGFIVAVVFWAASARVGAAKPETPAPAAANVRPASAPSPALSGLNEPPPVPPVSRQDPSAVAPDPRPTREPDDADPIRESSSWPLIVLSVVSVLATTLAGGALFLAFFARRRLDELAQVAREKSAETSQDIDKLSANLEKLNHRLGAREQTFAADLEASVNRAVKAASARVPEVRPDWQREPERAVGARRAATPPSAARTAPTMPAQVQPPPAPSTVPIGILLAAVQDAADGALADGIAADTGTLTTAIAGRMPDEIRRFLAANHLKVSAHNSSAGLLSDFNNPDFLTVTKTDGTGFLLPNPRATYAHSFVKYYDGESQSWPRFISPAKCSVDASGKATLLAKGRL